MTANAYWLLGMAASVLTALAPQAATMPPKWATLLGIGGVIGTAITAYMAQRPREEWTDAKRSAVQAKAKAEEKAEVRELKQAAKDIAPKEP